MLNIVFSLLDIYDPDLLILLLEILEETLKLGEFIMTEESSMENPFILDILKNKGVEKLEKLTQNQNNLISSKSSDIISRFLENIQETN